VTDLLTIIQGFVAKKERERKWARPRSTLPIRLFDRDASDKRSHEKFIRFPACSTKYT
jgi:hypothetical protein